MSYNFLGLVNDVAARLNEVQLTSSNFANSVGVYTDIKASVNGALNRINREEFEWPFNHVKRTELLVPNQIEYPFEADLKSLALDTFRLKGEEVLNVRSRRLKVLDYEEYLDKYPDMEFNPEDYADTPKQVYRGRNLFFGIVPPPDQAYSVVYEYYRNPMNLELFSDVPTIPEQFRWVILEGALYHSYLFRGGEFEATASNNLFQRGIADMRKIYINRTEYARSTVINS